jgi:calcium-translocating P-type ATPase
MIARALDAGDVGLTPSVARDRLREHGPNEIVEPPPTPMWLLFLRQFKSPLIYLLLAATVVTFLLGRTNDSTVIAIVLLINAIVGFVQERRAETSVRALKKLVSSRTRVIRGGLEQEIDSRELVVGDLVMLESGMRVPADLRVVSSNALLVDESILTGESVAVSKANGMAHAGTVVVSGRGTAVVVATGIQTELGKIAGSIQSAKPSRTPLEDRMDRFARQITIVVVIASSLSFLIGVARGEELVEMLLVAVALAVAAVPEGLPAVFTITLAIGVQRMAKRHAVLRRLGAVETLGSTTVIGSDKTGTLTENRMTVMEAWAPSGSADRAFLSAVLTNEAFAEENHGYRGDPTEVALMNAAVRRGLDPESLRNEHRCIADLPFEPERQYSASLRDDGTRRLHVKGAPERIARMCRDLDRGSFFDALHRMTETGLRVLAVAGREADDRASEEQLGDPRELELLGLIGMKDPPRAGVREAIRGCQAAGIRVVMMTGDHARTAESIGRELGIAEVGARVLTGKELEAMSDAELGDQVGRVSVLARVAPEHKLRIVRALKQRGEVVAVTGDGVNDAPALKAADIGIAMGRGGTDVAREASDMVLTDDNFVSIHAAVEEGRVTFDNLRKVTFFLLCTAAAEIFAVLGAQSFGWPIPFMPVQLLWLNLVTNSIQNLALAFEPRDSDVLEQPPRPRSAGILSALLWERMIVAGVVMAVGTLLLFHLELVAGSSIVRAQTIALTTMVLFQMFQVGMARSERRSAFVTSPFSNVALLVGTIAATALHAAVMMLPFTARLLHLEPVDPRSWLTMVLVAASIIPAMELHKLIRAAAGR